ncbi:MAG: hypothetical protein IPP19_15210 [Verrucomicrobia bacterium]|nr:hypothetical protein [Verrucomicrobiota bacterium]
MFKKILFILTACLAGLSCVSKAEAAFDRSVASERYRAWYARLQADIATVVKQVPAGQQITAADVARLCESSVVPGSRGASNLADWLNQSRKSPSHSVSGEIVLIGKFLVLMHLFEQATPVGEGGLFSEPPGNGFPDRSLQVIYMETKGCDGLDSVAVSELFKPYHLPPDGTLERDVYPFLLFEEKDGLLRYGGMGREWRAVFQRIYSMQFQ